MQHTKFMRAALKEALKGVGATSPNPAVGAVIVKNGRILSRGWHQRAGQPHAEVEALRALSSPELARGATLYVTLEPCLMCFGALLHARVDRVVFGASDPKVGVSRWLDSLQGAKLNHSFAFEGGLLEAECRDLLQGFFRRRRQA